MRHHFQPPYLVTLLIVGALGVLMSSANPARANTADNNDTKELSGTILIVGNGPERYLIEILAQEFEERHPWTSIDVFWHPNAKPAKAVLDGEADIGVSGDTHPQLRSIPVARDGIAILVNFSNPIENLTLQQVAAIFSGKIKFWSEIEEEAPQARIRLITRATNQNIRQGFEKLLGIAGQIPRSARLAGTEQQAINLVAGDLNSITFVSMAPALRAKEDGIPVKLLFINGVEPEYQTVLDNRYPLQRPIVFLTKPSPPPIVTAFIDFVLSDDGQRLMKRGKFYPLKEIY
ncbi:MAG: hypothetical protein D6690_01240 [Nitrospirae bacterium]|nr:MAG: hypothetical protein D6690_01240 [Nitrospirota bacterium]